MGRIRAGLVVLVGLLGAACREAPIVLPVEDGDALLVPVEVQDTSGAWQVLSMLVDTGAGISVLTPRGVQRLGLEVPASAPLVRLPTANGAMQEPLLWLPPVRLGDRVLSDVSAVRCRRCPEGIDGLLGLNVLERFRMTADVAAQTVTLTPLSAKLSAGRLDMVQWLHWRVRRQPVGDVPGVRVALTNRSDRPITEARLEVACLSDAPLVVRDLAPGEKRVLEVATPDGQPCTARQSRLSAGQWGAAPVR